MHPNAPALWVRAGYDIGPGEGNRRNVALRALYEAHAGQVPGPTMLAFLRGWEAPRWRPGDPVRWVLQGHEVDERTVRRWARAVDRAAKALERL